MNYTLSFFFLVLATTILTDKAWAGFLSAQPEEVQDSDVYDVVIIGCGAAGVQAALYAIKAELSYIVIEKDESCASFFQMYPRGRDFISFNKPNTPAPFDEWNESQRKDYALKFDWHSLQMTNNETAIFPTYTNKFYPKAEQYVEYIHDVVRLNKINVKYNSAVKEVEPFKEYQRVGGGVLQNN